MRFHHALLVLTASCSVATASDLAAAASITDDRLSSSVGTNADSSLPNGSHPIVGDDAVSSLRRHLAAKLFLRHQQEKEEVRRANNQDIALAHRGDDVGDDSDDDDEQQLRRAAAEQASAIVDKALAAGEMDGDAILGMINLVHAPDGDDDDGQDVSGGMVVLPSAADADADDAADESRSLVDNEARAPADGGTDAVRRAVPLRAAAAAEAAASTADGILGSIADDVAASAIAAAEGLDGLTEAEAAEAARVLTGEVETDAGLLPPVETSKAGKDAAAADADAGAASTADASVLLNVEDHRHHGLRADSGHRDNRAILLGSAADARNGRSLGGLSTGACCYFNCDRRLSGATRSLPTCYACADVPASTCNGDIGGTYAGAGTTCAAVTDYSTCSVGASMEAPSSTPSSDPSSIPSEMPSSLPSTVPSEMPSSLVATGGACCYYIDNGLLGTYGPYCREGEPMTTCTNSLAGTFAGAGTSCSDVTDVATCAIGSSMEAPSSAPSSDPSSIPSEMPSSLPSTVPSEMPSSVPSCPTDGNWVDCDDGNVRGTTTPCNDATACGGDCCVGSDACKETTACIKKDGSCNGNFACWGMGRKTDYELSVSGPSCTGQFACSFMFNTAVGSGQVSLSNSCLCDASCVVPQSRTHCNYNGDAGYNVPLDDLPSCGTSFNDIIGRTGYDGCRDPSAMPSEAPSSIPSESPSSEPSSVPTDASSSPSALPSSNPSVTPSDSPSGASSCPTDGNWVDCVEGYVRGTTSTCASECGDDCCVGHDACYGTTACIKKDGSCSSDGLYACYGAGRGTSYQLRISGPSCVGDSACYELFDRNANAGAGISVMNSCLCDFSCSTQCVGMSPFSYPGLPACGDDIIDAPGKKSSSCGPSEFPSSEPSSVPTDASSSPSALPSSDPSVTPSDSPSGASSCPTDGNWVDCVNGYVRGTTTPCNDATACDIYCCVGTDACKETTACIKMDGSCNGENACYKMGSNTDYKLSISGPSCTGDDVCPFMFNSAVGSGQVSVLNSCLCDQGCSAPPFAAQCLNNMRLYGLPACSAAEIRDVPGWDYSPCAPSDSPSAMPSSRVIPTPAPRPPPTRPSTRSPTKLPSSRPSGIPSASPSITASSSPSASPSASSSSQPSLPPTIMPSAGPTTSRPPSLMPSTKPSSPPSSPPSMTPSSTPSSEPSMLPSSSPTPECQDYSVFDQTMFSFRDFGPNSAKIIVRGALPAIIFEEATCDALKDQQDVLQIDIVSCCTSAVLTIESEGGRRLQLNNTNTTNTTVIADFNTNIVYTGPTCNNTCQVAFSDAINSAMFGDMIQGTVVDIQPVRTKSSKSGTSGGSSKSSKSGTSGGSMKSSKSMKSGSSF